jgi:phenylalanyl-tRNA synthetase beta chain
MKFSYNWIRELVPGLEMNPAELDRLITMKTAECEGIEEIPGEPLDTVIEIDNKSITHRPDLWGHHGTAREVAAITGRRANDPARLDLLPPGSPAIEVKIEDFGRCPRYSALVFENVTVQPSPLWLQRRLEAIGLNPISNIVDVTNYVMAEIAQPMHAFDAEKLSGGIFVRAGREGERMMALNGEEYELGTSTIVIADASGAVAIGGVIGGASTAISDSTKRMVLESANFHAGSIRKTSARLKLRTDASMRFEKAQDPVNTLRGLARAIELLNEVSPGIRLVGGVADAKRELKTPQAIALPLDWLKRKLGRQVDAGEVKRILENLEFKVEAHGTEVLSVTPPTWRATKDITIKDDLVEEVGRMIGYGSITPAAPLIAADVPPPNPERQFHHDVRTLVASLGYTEVYNYSFVSEDMLRAFGWDPAEHVAVANPISADQGLLRKSLLPGIRKNVLDNSKNFDSFRLFEIGKEIHKRDGSLPHEVYHLTAAIYSRDDGAAALFELKRLAESLMPGATVLPSKARSFEHPARAADVLWRDETVGRFFEFHPQVVETGRAAVIDIDLERVHGLRPQGGRYKPIRRYPASAFDLSVVADARELVADIEGALRRFAGDVVESLEFVRQYQGPPLPEGRKSVSFRLTAAAPDRTLSSEEVGAIRARIIEGMRSLNYELRV